MYKVGFLSYIDLDWFCVDQIGHIGHFTSASKGFVPLSVILSKENNERLITYFRTLEKS
ncbi:MAG: hypothetical protein ACFFAS_12295 [Promethearchaeota archaeon]